MPALNVDLEEEDLAAGSEDLDPAEMRRAVRRVTRGIEQATTADALGRLYRQLNPERSGSRNGSAGATDLGSVLSGVGKGYSSMAEAASGMFKAMAEMATAGPSRSAGDSGVSLAIALMGALMPMFQMMQDQGEKRWAEILTGERQHHTEVVADLRRTIAERSGPSQFDAIGSGMMQTMFQKQMEEMTRGPRSWVDEITDMGQKMAHLRGALRGLGDPENPVSSEEGYLKNRELSLREMEITAQGKASVEREKKGRAMWTAVGRAGPQALGQLVAQGLQAFGLGVPQVGPMGMGE